MAIEDERRARTTDNHEERLRTLEIKLGAHEGICAERYKNIIDNVDGVIDELKKLYTGTQKRMDIMIVSIVIISFVLAFGPEVAGKLFGVVFK